ncbi:hypothetical protein SVAN01_08812 [Stagonosporopsis vannaccii]|nr:hypothetical protein SVAN01_08812 [Stagonosporopsis vannaccii]
MPLDMSEEQHKAKDDWHFDPARHGTAHRPHLLTQRLNNVSYLSRRREQDSSVPSHTLPSSWCPAYGLPIHQTRPVTTPQQLRHSHDTLASLNPSPKSLTRQVIDPQPPFLTSSPRLLAVPRCHSSAPRPSQRTYFHTWGERTTAPSEVADKARPRPPPPVTFHQRLPKTTRPYGLMITSLVREASPVPAPAPSLLDRRLDPRRLLGRLNGVPVRRRPDPLSRTSKEISMSNHVPKRAKRRKPTIAARAVRWVLAHRTQTSTLWTARQFTTTAIPQVIPARPVVMMRCPPRLAAPSQSNISIHESMPSLMYGNQLFQISVRGVPQARLSTPRRCGSHLDASRKGGLDDVVPRSLARWAGVPWGQGWGDKRGWRTVRSILRRG